MPAMTSDPDKRDFPARPIIGVGAVVWHDEQVLLIQRGKDPHIGSWSLPGGAQELGETLTDAVRREVMEETGIRISQPRLIDTVDLITPAANGAIKFHYTLIDYVARARDVELKPGGDARDARWVRFSDLNTYRLWQKTVIMINRSRDLL